MTLATGEHETLELTAELLVDGAELADPVISPDGRLVAYILSARDGTRHRSRTLWVAAADASSPPRALTHGPVLSVAPRWAPDSASLTVIVDGQFRFCHLSTRPGRAEYLTSSSDGMTAAVLASTAYEPRNVYAGPPGGELARISDSRPEARRIRWGLRERLEYQACDGLDLDGLLILPPGRTRADGPFPLVTLVHGGPYGRWADQFYGSWWAPRQWLAAAGFAIFMPTREAAKATATSSRPWWPAR